MIVIKDNWLDGRNREKIEGAHHSIEDDTDEHWSQAIFKEVNNSELSRRIFSHVGERGHRRAKNSSEGPLRGVDPPHFRAYKCRLQLISE